MAKSLTPAEEVELAVSLGFVAVVDQNRGAPWHRFCRGSLHVWSLGWCWQSAELVNGFYCNHVKFGDLRGALGRVSGGVSVELV